MRVAAAFMMRRCGITLVASVEDPSDMPPVVRDCFLYEVPVDAPNAKERLMLLQAWTAHMPLDTVRCSVLVFSLWIDVVVAVVVVEREENDALSRVECFSVSL